ncbi:phiSA1p31-related protein [Streptomyces filamentosus]|uniref:PhiSA1p31-related protein n=3 Tax=Streptomyces TaxID=1883 RepID=A0ABY4V674_STRFL|nr:phiSA1p31-related protein [Streptomyces filamentosus]EFE74536.1 conserved hypothetical protein [Streptomyces filamentosus NRRL 15998]ESU46471.1 hypothetical protein P376_5556 [Streptomyces sp. HCCB10043]EWS91636.1 hypothetical protein SSIG_02082 [Streptomyces filamentosus NRRL 11379]USC49731.1 phiSA1p31-related protein [Streptomyces filamentosus]
MRIKMIDVDELWFVVTVARGSGAAKVDHPGVCGKSVATALREIAEQLDALHPPYACDATPEPQHDYAEPLGPGGTLDAARRTWTDGTGHTWDLSGRWIAAETGGEWEWSGQLDTSGRPVMRAVGSDVQESLDVLRVVYGPISPSTGGRS